MTTEPDYDFPRQYINFHAFLANLSMRAIFRTDPTFAIWALRDGLETYQPNETEVWMLAAA